MSENRTDIVILGEGVIHLVIEAEGGNEPDLVVTLIKAFGKHTERRQKGRKGRQQNQLSSA